MPFGSCGRIQGVNNAIRGTGNWPEDTARVESALREAIPGATSVPFAFARLQPVAVPQSTQQAWDAVRAQQTDFAGPGRALFDLPAGPMTTDGVHPQSRANMAIGERILDVMTSLVP